MNERFDYEQPLDEISLGESCYVDDLDLKLDKLICRYTQNNRIKGVARKFALYDKTHLIQQKDSHFNKIPEHRIDLTFLAPEPTKHLFVSWKILLTGVSLLIVSILLFLFIDQLQSVVGIQLVQLAVISLTTVGVIFIILSYYRSYSTLVFHSAVAKIPLLVITRKPRDKNYKKFIDVIGKCINYSRNRNGITLQDRLRGEMKDLRRLKGLGIISEDVYNEAQKIILASIK
jgi:hypothetical protein